MAELTSVAYVGPKKTKVYKDPETRVEYVFSQYEKQDVPTSLANRLFKFKGVFIKGDEVKDAKKKQDAAEKERNAKDEALRKMQAEAEKNNQRTLLLNGSVVDLNKMTMAKLKTLVESESIEVPFNGEGRDDYASAVKAALLQKYPDSEVVTEPAIETAQSEAEDEAEKESADENQDEAQKEKPESKK